MIKGRYVATVIMDFEFEETDDTLTFDEIKEKIVGGELTRAIKSVLDDDIFDEQLGTLQVEQQFADLYKNDSKSEGEV